MPGPQRTLQSLPSGSPTEHKSHDRTLATTKNPEPPGMSRVSSPLLLGVLLLAGLACDRPRRPEGPHTGAGVTEIDRPKAEIPTAVGQTIYVPAYSSVPTADTSLMYQLA